MTTDVTNIWEYKLTRGGSSDPHYGACMMDAVSWFAYGELGDHPACVSPVLAGYCRAINDLMSDTDRQQLRAYIPSLINSVDPAAENERAEYLARQALTIFAPAVLTHAKRKADAIKLRALGEQPALFQAHTFAKGLDCNLPATRFRKFLAILKDIVVINRTDKRELAALIACQNASEAAYCAMFGGVVYHDGALNLADAGTKAGLSARFLPAKVMLDGLIGALRLGKVGSELDAEVISGANETFASAASR